MVAGCLIIGVVAGLWTGATALILGHSLWVAGMAYVLGGMLGMVLGLVWGYVWSWIEGQYEPGLPQGLEHGHEP
jgi:hypothetical protein